jgi:hypothetical protein
MTIGDHAARYRFGREPDTTAANALDLGRPGAHRTLTSGRRPQASAHCRPDCAEGNKNRLPVALTTSWQAWSERHDVAATLMEVTMWSNIGTTGAGTSYTVRTPAD